MSDTPTPRTRKKRTDSPVTSTGVAFRPEVLERIKVAARTEERSVSSLLRSITMEWLADRGYLEGLPKPNISR